MQNTKHTQGKWEVKTPNYSFQTIESEYGKVCTLSHQFGTDEAEANAHLIAAAPELLEALEMALEWIDALPKEIQLPEMPGFDRDEIDNLIAKAKGGQL